jgi:phage gp36-like protein
MVQIASYATLDDLQNQGIIPQFFTGDLAPSSDAIVAALVYAASYIDSIIGVSDKLTFPLPTPYDPTLVQANVVIAIWNLLSVRGFNPEDPSDKAVRTRYDDAIKWLDKVANGRAKLLRQKTTTNVLGVQPEVVCNSPRGLRNWSGSIGGNGN